jgi:hypothetical protein
LRIKAIKPSGVLELQGANECTIWDHSKNCVPCHLPNLDPTIITSTWIPPLDYPCQVFQKIDDAGQMLLCDNVMVDTIYSASSQSSFKFPLAFGIVHHVLLKHLDLYPDHATLFSA